MEKCLYGNMKSIQWNGVVVSIWGTSWWQQHPYGGPIALTRDETKFNKTQVSGKPIVFIFTSAGRKISSFKWNSGYLLSVGWSRSEDLVCIQEDGAVLLYDMFGTYQHTFNMGQEVKDTRVAGAQVFSSHQGTGVAVLTKANRIFVVNNIEEPRTRKYPDMPSGCNVECWCAVREGRQTNILVSQGRELLLLNQQEQRPQQLYPEWSDGGGCIVAMAVSSNSRHIAMLSDSGKLWLGSSDMRIKYCEYDAKSQLKPKQIAWCGTGAVVLLWDLTLEVVSVNGEASSYYLDSGSHLVQELDAVRIIGSSHHDLLQKVPLVVTETVGIGSMAPGALLLEAANSFRERSTRAMDCLGMISENLEEAVSQCLQAAQHQFTHKTQKMLLRVSILGKDTSYHRENHNMVPSNKMLFRVSILCKVISYKRKKNCYAVDATALRGGSVLDNWTRFLKTTWLFSSLSLRWLRYQMDLESINQLSELTENNSGHNSENFCEPAGGNTMESVHTDFEERMTRKMSCEMSRLSGFLGSKISESNQKKINIHLHDYNFTLTKVVLLLLLRLLETYGSIRCRLPTEDSSSRQRPYDRLTVCGTSSEFLTFLGGFPLTSTRVHEYCCR
ncbi:unnamed protein product, partial [Meganyctiphanes norvegica]